MPHRQKLLGGFPLPPTHLVPFHLHHKLVFGYQCRFEVQNAVPFLSRLAFASFPLSPGMSSLLPVFCPVCFAALPAGPFPAVILHSSLKCTGDKLAMGFLICLALTCTAVL
jgi:hypothetical protein